MDDLADRLERAAEALATVDKRTPRLTVAAAAFGAGDDAGLPGRVGRELYEHWTAVLGARSDEAASAATRLTGAARSVRAAARSYDETDDSVRRRIAREA
jgi:hypothetical protein